MTMKVILGDDEIINRIQDNIVTPYIRCDKSIKGIVEYGYCIVNEANEVIEKYMIQCEFKDIILKQLRLFDTPINIMVTTDGYLRFWTDNVNFYLKWILNEKERNIALKVARRAC